MVGKSRMLLTALYRPHGVCTVVDGGLHHDATAVRVYQARQVEALLVQLERSLGERVHGAVGKLDAVRIGAVEEHRRPLN